MIIETNDNSTGGKWTTEEMLMLYHLKVAKNTHKQITDIMGEKIGRREYSENLIHKKWQQTDWVKFLEVQGEKEELLAEIKGRESEKQKVIETTLSNQERLVKRDQARTQLIIDAIQSSILRLPKPKLSDLKYNPNPKLTYRDEHMGVILSDLHLGASYTKEDTGGLSEFNIDIAKKRLSILRDTTISIAERHRHVCNIPELHVFCLGDIVAGMNDAGAWSSSYIDLDIYDQMIEGAAALRNVLSTWAKSFDKVNFYGVYGNHGRCLPITTKVLTPNGYKNANEIIEGDLVGTLNVETMMHEFQPVLRKIYIDNEQNMIRHESSNFVYEATEDHDILYLDKKKKVLRKRKYKTLTGINDKFPIPICSPSGMDEYDVSDNVLAFLGWMMTDGRYLPKCKTLQIYQSKPKNVDYIRHLLDDLEVEYSVKSRNREIKEIKSSLTSFCFTIFSSDFTRKIKEYLPVRESIPSWMYKLSDRQISVLLQHIAMGDEVFRQKRTLCTSQAKIECIWGKKEFLEQLAGLLATHGIASSINIHKNGSDRVNYYLYIRVNRYYSLDTTKTSRIIHNKPVWCVEVENGTIFVLNEHGDSFITGNCGKRGSHKDGANWDRICYEFVKTSMSEYDNIHWEIPRAWWLQKKIQNHNFYMTHGDGIRGSLGVPYYGVERAERLILGLMKEKPDYLLLGHFHTPAELQTNSGRILMNGSFMNGDMYSLRDLRRKDRAEQKLFGIHTKKGVTWSYNIQLDQE